MIVPLFQVLAFAAVAFYFSRWRAGLKRRNQQTWESLLGKLRVDWSARELSDQFLWKEGLNATPDDAWRRMDGPKGLWVMYQNSRVMLEMADYALATVPMSTCWSSRRCAATRCRFAYVC